MKFKTKEDDRVVDKDVSRYSRVAVDKPEQGDLTIERVDVVEEAEHDVVRVHSLGAVVGELKFKRGLGKRVARWLLPHAKLEA